MNVANEALVITSLFTSSRCSKV